MWYRIARGYGFNPRVREGRDAKAATGAVIKRDGFNPRVREGRDAVEGLQQGWIIVSIHASVKDATCEVSTLLDMPSLFQSTRP